MGCSSSCAIFEAFSTALEWLAKHYLCVSGVLHILDDFLFIATSQGKCASDLNNFLSLCDCLGVPIAHEKTEGPSTTFFGSCSSGCSPCYNQVLLLSSTGRRSLFFSERLFGSRVVLRTTLGFVVNHRWCCRLLFVIAFVCCSFLERKRPLLL